MSGQRALEDGELHAYVDGLLDPDQARAVEDVLTRDAELADRVAAYRKDKLALKDLYGPLELAPLPSAWKPLIETEDRRVPVRRILSVIAAAMLVVVGGSSLYMRLSAPADTSVVATALSARHDGITPLQTLAASTDSRTYNATLRTVIGANIKVPVLDRLGYRFAGLRTYEGAAEVLYKNDEGRVFTLYLRRSEGQVRFDQFERDGLRVCIWQDDRISMVMAGNISAAIMQRLASLAYTDLAV